VLKREFSKQFSLVAGRVLNKPDFIGLEVEDRCCLECRHCDLWKAKPLKKRLTFSQQKRVIKKLSDWLGKGYLNFDGGEPFLNKDVFELAKYASSLGLKARINTNGALIDKQMAQKVVKADIFSLAFSLEALDASLHDRIRGTSGTFKRAMRAMMILNQLRKKEKSSLILTINTVIMRPNLEEVEKLIYWTQEKRFDGISFQPPRLDWYQKSKLWPRYSQVEKVIKRIARLKKRGYPVINSTNQLKIFLKYFQDPLRFGRDFPCRVSLNNFIVDLKGKARLCYAMGSCGNLLKTPPGEIWMSRQANNQRKAIKNCRRSCRVLLCNQDSFFKDIFERFYFKFAKRFRSWFREIT
jgi:MoaA/NifB/PqqE/SkfB family radical SAM enzyme